MAEMITMRATEPTVRTVLLMIARQMTPSFEFSVSTKFWKNWNCFGQEKARSDASAGGFAACSRTNANGTRKTTTETRIAMIPTIQARRRSRVTAPPAFC